ncbi:hypothetical protein OG698_45930 [Streptomyces sp. NBC_01003]|uniref:hypothetical protein n=1 Tax=Streptomyces sp. NBC_01003 TaxID=2903714 RepID=UPI0038647483|nr:hypothetical protein OG698_45930 [Streptomyces sp. NBC_01003]
MHERLAMTSPAKWRISMAPSPRTHDTTSDVTASGRVIAQASASRLPRSLGATWTHYEEKEAAVNIAVSLVADIAQQTATSAMVISADSDLSPAIRTALVLNPRAHTMAAFPPKQFSNELKWLMPASFIIGRAKFAQAQLPQRAF